MRGNRAGWAVWGESFARARCAHTPANLHSPCAGRSLALHPLPQKAKVEAAISKSGPGCDPGYYKASLADPCTVCGVDGFCPGGNAPRKAVS